MPSGSIQWGVLGYARIAQKSLIPAIRAARNSELYAVASRDPAKLRECAEQFGVPRLHADYESLLEDPGVQAVYIPLPNSMHKEWAIRAMRMGKAVLCEKPLALDADEVRQMIAVSRETGMPLMEAYMYRFAELAAKVKSVVDSGGIGRVTAVHSSFRYVLDRPNTIKARPELGGGALYDVGCYPVSFVQMLTGRLPVSCTAEAVVENGVDVSFSGVLRYEDGLLATVDCGFNAFRATRTEVAGTLGRLEVAESFSGAADVIRVTTAEGVREIPAAETGRYVLEVEEFADAILEGRPPQLSLEDSLQIMETLDLLRQAARL